MAPAFKRGDRLVVASHNAHKLVEIGEMVAPFGLSVVSAGELGIPEPEETGTTFAENAEIKALAVAKAANLPALADDSGLVVEALGGAPGIYSARWAGPGKDFAMAMKKVADRLDALGASRPEHRRAAFVAVLCLAFPDGATRNFAGEVTGHLVYPPRGENGFGYDPMFVPDGHEETFGELPPETKAGFSHRARAFARFAEEMLVR
ncbi:MAG: RdgB/HAM1 family non-canonical purine NTP pyrophosphatase [Bauldia sp.]|uniref:RdgB/HAM1 family non-canonical purine NTP pyrophosphatase n=1 Tax=Bauldia sp. TaxID=2575872 RepID=UPI001D891BAF|nr:RdgB/HAM1 family non-canonical purine NTP pyrophosphatase [Bauldia sp.]MCB1496751.1 RdgB/HAM1 family non-canonical purine NTP pyrophosphatase [Bauldia sp.]